MRQLRAFLIRLAGVFRKHEREFEEEMQANLDLHISDNVALGMSAEEARRQAILKFGGIGSTKEAYRDRRGIPLLESLFHDVRYASRVLRRNPAFTSIAVLTLALGIGANTAIFSVFEAAILRLLPVPNPGELYLVRVSGGDSSFSHPLYRRMSDALPAGAHLAAMTQTRRGQISLPGGSPERASFQLVSGSFFDTLGVRPALGRLFASDDDRTIGAHPVAVISHGYWVRRWSQSPGVLGTVAYLNGTPLTIIGVAAPGFTGTRLGDTTDFWVPLAMQMAVRHFDNASSYGSVAPNKGWAAHENVFWLELIARVPANIEASSIAASFDVILKQNLTQLFGNEADAEAKRRRLARQIALAPGSRGFDGLRERFLTPLRALMGMSGLVLLIACANLASLLMSRAQSRQREIGVRLSIGAGRGRLIRQLLTESLLLAVLGSVLGSLIGIEVGPALLSLLAGGPVPLDFSVNLQVLAFSAVLCVLTTIICGLAPALRSTRVDLAAALKVTSGAADSRSRWGVGQVMVSAQVALSVVLLVCAGLLSRTLHNFSRVDVGYQAQHLLSAQLDTRLAGIKEQDLLPVYRRIEARLRQIPGVISVSVSLCPLATGGGCGQYSSVYAEGFVPKQDQGVQAQELFVGWDYLRTLGLQLVRGRAFTERDAPGSPRVVIVNQTFARHYFGHDDVLGRRIGYGFTNPRDFEIVGVIRDMPVNNLREPVPRFVLHPIAQEPGHVRNIDIRAQGDPLALASAVRKAVQETEPSLPVYSTRTMIDQIDRTLTQERAVAWLSGVFSALAAALACIGLYGLLSYRLSRRTAEIGIRMALGAPSGSVQWLVLRDALRLTAVGLAIGIALSLAAARSVRGLLFGVSPSDPITYLAVTLALAALALLASLLPARRATRIDPIVTLRAE